MKKLDYDYVIGSKPNINFIILFILWLGDILFSISYRLTALFCTSIILLAVPKENDQ